jgi:hypothetical protein
VEDLTKNIVQEPTLCRISEHQNQDIEGILIVDVMFLLTYPWHRTKLIEKGRFLYLCIDMLVSV